MTTPLAQELFAWIATQASMGCRRPGSAADQQNERFLEAKLREFGLSSVRREPIPIVYSEASECRLDLVVPGDTKRIEAFAIPYTAFTPAEGLTAPLVHVDPHKLFEGSADWRGKIVVTEIGFPPLDAKLLIAISLGHFDPDATLSQVRHPATWVRLGWHVYQRAARYGAAGFIGILKDQPGRTCKMYAPYGFRERDILDKPIPGLWVGRDAGAELLASAKSSNGRASMTIAGARQPAVTHNVVGEVPGTSDEVLVLSCHHDSPFESPVEDASGVAVVLALARHFAARRSLKRRLVVLFSAGHFYGSIGTRTFILEHRHDLLAKTALEISIEHIALEAAEDAAGRLVPTGRPEATGVFVPFNRALATRLLGACQAHGLDRTILLPSEGPLGSYPPTDGGDWYDAGVPVINWISNPVYLLTADDALEWVDQERLPRVVAAFAEIIEHVDGMSWAEIRKVDAPFYRLAMRMLRHWQWARTTTLGLKPVY